MVGAAAQSGHWLAPTEDSRGQRSHRVCLGYLLLGGDEVQTHLAGLGGTGPPSGDDLGLGVEVDTFLTVDLDVTEQGVFPTAEGVVADRDRDRNVDADHACFHIEGEAASIVTGFSEDG